MKKLFAALLSLMLLCLPAVHAEEPFSLFPTPAPTEDSETPSAGGSLSMTFNGVPFEMEFDADPQYSYTLDGYVQASFVYESDDGGMYEFFIVFPENVQSGSVVSAETCIADGDDESCVLLFVTDDTQEINAIAAQEDGARFPEGSDYALRFESVSSSDSLTTFTGSFSATLVAIDESFEPLQLLGAMTGTFDFTMKLSGAQIDIPLPYATPYAAPKGLVTPPDAQKI